MRYQKSWTQALQEVYKINEIRWDLKDKGPEPAAEIIKGAGKQLKDYAIKSGGIDKDDFLTTADVLLKGKVPTEKQIPSDTAPREFVHGLMARKFGWKYVEQKYGIKFTNRKVFPEEVEIVEAEQISAKDFDALKKGDTVAIEYGSAMSGGKASFKVTAKNVVGKEKVEKVTLQSVSNPKGVKHFLYKRGDKVSMAQGDMAVTVKSFTKESVDEETELKEADYELYHSTFSGAMQHAYAHAKKKGFTVDPDEIDSKVAVGPKKPSSGKTNRYILGTDKKKKVHIQVANLDNKKYELNMYIEETQPKKDNMDLKETIRQVLVNEILKKGDTVTVPHKGKMVKGKVVRYDKGGPEDPFYVVDVGENESPKIPVHKIKEDTDDSEPGTQGDDEEYAKKRDAVLKKYGVKACGLIKDEKEKKQCFQDLDDAHVADHEESYAQTPGAEPSKQKVGVKKKAKEPQEQKEQSKLLSHIRKLMKGA